MPRDEFRSERHQALSDYAPPDRYCACKQGRGERCVCSTDGDVPVLPMIWPLMVVILAGVAFAYNYFPEIFK